MDLELTRIFVKVVQNSSFSKAAEILKMPKSTVSKAISRLERETATRLMIRSTRSLSLTDAGRIFYERSIGPILQLEEAQKSLYGKDSSLTGLLRITAPEDLGTFIVAPAIASLSSEHPDLKFDLNYTDELVDLVRVGFDIAIRIGKAQDSNLKIKRAGAVVLIPIASPQYLKSKKTIKHPSELKDHPCLTLDLKSLVDRWTLKSSKGTVHVPIDAKIVSNQMSSLLQMAVAGAGIALVPNYLAQTYIDTGELVQLLPEWSTPELPISIITPLAPSSSAKLKVTVDKILEAISSALNSQSS